MTKTHQVICNGTAHIVEPMLYQHLAPQRGTVLYNNVFLHEGLCVSISVHQRQPGMQGVVSPYSLKVMMDTKEHTWERIRAAHYNHQPSRCGAIFILDPKYVESVQAKWFPNENRNVLDAHIVKGSRTAHCDAKWLDVANQDEWEANARRYWSGDQTADPIMETLVDGAVYFPGWKAAPFGIGAGLFF